MGQFVGAVQGMKEACEVLKYPVVSGNVSLYNETNGVAIPPTPAIGGVGLVPDIARMANLGLEVEGNLLVVIGREAGHLGQSLYQLTITGRNEGAPPPVDLADEIKAGNLVRSLIREEKVRAVHDVSDGGLLVAIAEMALAGGIGVQLFPYEGKLPVHAAWFGEDQGRYVLEASPELAEEIIERARLLALPARVVGRVGGDALMLKGEAALALQDLGATHEAWLPQYMGSA
jgi:phosphoribosylformylglycinamidine synthase